MKILKFAMILSAFGLLITSCKSAAQGSKIQSVSYTNTYGRGGSTTVIATKDTITAVGAGGRVPDFPNFKKKTDPKIWNKIVSGLDITTLDNTKNGARRGVFDGNDEIFTIITTDKEYQIINASADAENYKQLEKLKATLNSLLPDYQK